MDWIDFLYKADKRDQAIFGEILKYYNPPEVFPHGPWALVASLPKNPPDGDGHACEIYECRVPARFFRLVVLPGKNSMGEISPGWAMSTGSGDEAGKLIVQIAKAVTEGMLGLEFGKETS